MSAFSFLSIVHLRMYTAHTNAHRRMTHIFLDSLKESKNVPISEALGVDAGGLLDFAFRDFRRNVPWMSERDFEMKTSPT